MRGAGSSRDDVDSVSGLDEREETAVVVGRVGERAREAFALLRGGVRMPVRMDPTRELPIRAPEFVSREA